MAFLSAVLGTLQNITRFTVKLAKVQDAPNITCFVIFSINWFESFNLVFIYTIYSHYYAI